MSTDPEYVKICEEQAFVLLKILDKKYGVKPSRRRALYQYTSLESIVEGILGSNRESGKEILLRATCLSYMNDPLELKTGVDLANFVLQNVIDESLVSEELIPDVRKQIYATCFSQKRDSLPMWSTYGNNGQGVALLFDAKSLVQSYSSKIFHCIYDHGDDVLRLLKDWLRKGHQCSTSEYEKYAETLPESRTPSKVVYSLLMFAAKNKSYKYEDEVRAMVMDDSPIHYRVSGNLIIPYKEHYLPKEALHEIIIGPCNDPVRAKESVIGYLESIGMGHVFVSNSDVPYRLK